MSNWWDNDPVETQGDWWSKDPVDAAQPAVMPAPVAPAAMPPTDAGPGTLGDLMTAINPPLTIRPPMPARPDGLPDVGTAPVAPVPPRLRGRSLNTMDERMADVGTAPVAPVPPRLRGRSLNTMDERMADDPVIDPFAGESLGDLLGRRGQQFAQGGTEAVASLPEALAIMAAASERSISKDASGYVSAAVNQIVDANQRLQERPDMPAEQRSRIEDVIRQSQATIESYAPIMMGSEEYEKIKPAFERELFSKGDALRDVSAEKFGTPDPRDESYWGQFAYGLGNAAGMIVTGPAAPLTGAAMNSSQIYKEALDLGADEETATEAARWAGVVGVSEAIPIGRALKLLPPRLRGEVGSRLVRRATDILQASGEEAVQEYAAQVANNLIAVTKDYDPDRPLTQGALESALVGLGVGAAVGTAGVVFDRQNPEETPVTRPPTPEEEAQSPPGPVAPTPPDAETLGALLLQQDQRVNTQQPVGPDAPTQEAAPTPNTAAPAPIEPSIVPPRVEPVRPEARPVETPVTEQVTTESQPVTTPTPTGVGVQDVPSQDQPRVGDVAPEPVIPQKRPMTALVRRGGIGVDPDSPAGRELRAMGVTSRNSPGVFRRGGSTNLDNIPAAEHPELAQLIGTDDTGTYLDPQGLMGGLMDEMNGRPVQTPAQLEAQAAYDDYSRSYNQIATENQSEGIEQSPWVIPARNDDFIEGQERRESVEVAVRGVGEAMNVDLTGPLRSAIVDELDANGGDVAVAVENAITREVQNAESGTAQGGLTSESVPGFGEPVSQPGSESTGQTRDGGTGRAGTDAGFAVEDTPEGQQSVIPGTREDGITEAEDRAKREAAAQAQQSKMRRGGQSGVDTQEGGLFAPQQTDIFDQPQTQPEKPKSQDKEVSLRDEGDVNKPRPPSGSVTPKFGKVSWNNKPSVYNAAFVDAGVDPEVARMKPLEWQIETLSKIINERYGFDVTIGKRAVIAKNLMGRKVPREARDLNPRMAIDQMLDAYQTLEMLSSVLGIPTKALALPIDGKPLTLELTSAKRMRGALGMFSYGGGKRTIHMPDRSNSFAHEWGHALDHYLTNQVDHTLMDGMLTRELTQPDGKVQPEVSFTHPKRPITDAMTHVLIAMFGENAKLGAVRLRLELLAGQTDPNGNQTPSAKEAQKAIDAMKKGGVPAKKYMSEYFKNSKEFDEAFQAGGYFTDPAEMFARAFEAFVGRQIGKQTDAPQNFMSKGAWAYDAPEGDKRLALTFPKGTDADIFGMAMARLTRALKAVADIPAGEGPIFPKNPDRVRPQLISPLPESERRVLGRWIDREVEGVKETIGNLFSAKAALTTIRALPKEERVSRQLMRHVVNSSSGALHDIARLYEGKARKAIDNIAMRLGSRPGYGQFTGDNYQSESEADANGKINWLHRENERAFGKKLIPEKYHEQVRDALSGRTEGVEPFVQTYAQRVINGTTDKIWYELKDVGLEPGYQRGYMPHVHDRGAVDADPNGFKKAAKKVYQLMFDREVAAQTDPDERWADIKQAVSKLNSDREPQPDGTYNDRSWITAEAADLYNAVKKTRSEISKLKSRLKKAKGEDARARIEGKIAEANERLEDLTEDLLPVVRDLWAEYSVEHWYVASAVGRMQDVASLAPSANFLQGRKLPPETSKLLADYMVTDPNKLLTGYIYDSMRRKWYAKLFGEPTPTNPEGAELRVMLEAAATEGVTEQHIDAIKTMVSSITGQNRPRMRAFAAAMGKLSAWGQMALLGNALFSSLPENYVVALRSGSMRDAARALRYQVQLAVKKGERHQLYDMARMIGLITDYNAEVIMENRMGLDAVSMSERDRELVSKYHQLTLLTPWTMYSKVVNIPVSHAIILRLLRHSERGQATIANRLRDVIAGGSGKFADGELNEIGVAKEDRPKLLKWLEDDLDGRIPEQEDMLDAQNSMTDEAYIYQRALRRMTDSVIQNPQRSDKPTAASVPDLAPMYAIQSFIMAFHRQVILRSLRRGVSEDAGLLSGERLGKGAANLMLAGMPAGTLFMGALLATILREEIQNADKLEEMEDDEYWDYVMRRAWSRTGLMGRFDPLYNAVVGVRYDNDLTGLLAGAYPSFFGQQVQTMLEAPFGRNAYNTNTAEWSAASAAYRGIVAPLTARIVTTIAPTTGIGRLAGTAALYQVSQYDTSRQFANAAVGSKGRKYSREGIDPPWWEMGEKKTDD